MKYFFICLGLLSLNSFASEHSEVSINNQSEQAITAYYQGPKGYQSHKAISANTRESIFIKRPSTQSPQSIFFHWNDRNRQKKFILEQNPYNYFEIFIQPALVFTRNSKILGTIKTESFSSSSEND